MNSLHLTLPGTWIEHKDPQIAYQLQQIVNEIQLQFDEAAAALLLFEGERRRKPDRGLTPRQNNARLRIFAKAYVYALSQIEPLLKQLSCTAPEHSEQIGKYVTHYSTLLPSVRKVRDSEQHKDERVVGMARKRKIDLKPVDLPEIQAPSGTLVISNIMDDRFTTVTDDGSLGVVEINEKTLSIVLSCIQDALRVLDWGGPAL